MDFPCDDAPNNWFNFNYDPMDSNGKRLIHQWFMIHHDSPWHTKCCPALERLEAVPGSDEHWGLSWKVLRHLLSAGARTIFGEPMVFPVVPCSQHVFSMLGNYCGPGSNEWDTSQSLPPASVPVIRVRYEPTAPGSRQCSVEPCLNQRDENRRQIYQWESYKYQIYLAVSV